jgi:hypothetical protein
LAEEAIQVVCERAVDLAVEFDDPNLLKNLCLFGQDAGLSAEDIQQTCGLATELAVKFNDPYVFHDMCFFGDEAGLDEEDVQVACERAVDLAIETGAINLLGDLCLQGQNVGLPAGDLRQACDQASNQILPGEQRSESLVPGTFDLWSFQGLEGQTVTIALSAIPDNLNLNMIIHTPRGEMLTEIHTGGGNLTALIDQLQLAESGAYIIGVFNPDSISGEYNLEFMLVEAGP